MVKPCVFMLCCSSFMAFAIVMPTLGSGNLGSKKRQQMLQEIGKQFNLSVHNITEEQTRLYFKMNSYCKCTCCQETLPEDEDSGEESCDRTSPITLPKNFKCPSSFCIKNNTATCNSWDQGKCERACFCQRCSKSNLEPNDRRCNGAMAHLQPGPSCDCNSIAHPPPCAPESADVEELWLQVSLLRERTRLVHCLLGCFCKNCDVEVISKIIPSIKADCAAAPFKLEEGCNCPPSCPTAAIAMIARQKAHEIRISQASHAK
ncbi:uncharacterized protein LOC143444852 isoform X1 [Clavelina lepadiformis]|uniref:uncharacterized protein LOC143444852 isoform X1 n=2 Tax=Clavelina lepadiformis TaxID=159417 RepID=UPI0040418599